MPRRVKDFIDISEYTSLDDLIRYLQTIRDNFPEGHEAELKIRGDDVFGRRLTITYFREQTPEETELEVEICGFGQGQCDDRGPSPQARRSPVPDEVGEGQLGLLGGGDPGDQPLAVPDFASAIQIERPRAFGRPDRRRPPRSIRQWRSCRLRRAGTGDNLPKRGTPRDIS